MASDEDHVKPAVPRRSGKRRRKPRRKPDEVVWYEMHIEDWEYYFGLSPADSRRSREPGPFSQSSTLDLKGPLVRPEGHKCKRCILILSAWTGTDRDRRGDPPAILGSLSSVDELLCAYVLVPAERMAELVAVAASWKLRSALIVGTRLRYRSGAVHRYHVSTEIEEDEEDFAEG